MQSSCAGIPHRNLQALRVTCSPAVGQVVVRVAAGVQHAQQVGVRGRLLHAASGCRAAGPRSAVIAAAAAAAAAATLMGGCHAVHLHSRKHDSNRQHPVAGLMRLRMHVA